MEAAPVLDQYLPYLELFGELSGEEFDMGREDRAWISGISEFEKDVASQDSTVIIVELSKSPRYRFVSKIKKAHLRVSMADLEGEAKIVGSINRKLNREDPPIGLEQIIPAFEAMRGFQDSSEPHANRADRRAAKKGKVKKIEEDPFSIGFPAATLIPIGIFR